MFYNNSVADPTDEETYRKEEDNDWRNEYTDVKIEDQRNNGNQVDDKKIDKYQETDLNSEEDQFNMDLDDKIHGNYDEDENVEEILKESESKNQEIDENGQAEEEKQGTGSSIDTELEFLGDSDDKNIDKSESEVDEFKNSKNSESNPATLNQDTISTEPSDDGKPDSFLPAQENLITINSTDFSSPQDKVSNIIAVIVLFGAFLSLFTIYYVFIRRKHKPKPYLKELRTFSKSSNYESR